MRVVDATQERHLLAVARDALEARVRGLAPPPAYGAGLVVEDVMGAFVTIHYRGDLRGCLGHLDLNRPLGEAVADLAAAVADSDPRFDAVQPFELSDIALEISVLGAEYPMTLASDIELGRHGLIVEQGSRRGLLLPQVATQHGWDRETFLAETCRKAALPADAWRRGAQVFLFEAQVFGEILNRS